MVCWIIRLQHRIAGRRKLAFDHSSGVNGSSETQAEAAALVCASLTALQSVSAARQRSFKWKLSFKFLPLLLLTQDSFLREKKKRVIHLFLLLFLLHFFYSALFSRSCLWGWLMAGSEMQNRGYQRIWAVLLHHINYITQQGKCRAALGSMTNTVLICRETMFPFVNLIIIYYNKILRIWLWNQCRLSPFLS